MAADDRVRVLGIRHHGPGSARAVVRALEQHDPDLVLIEGPPETDALVRWVGHGLEPPVALLSYAVDNPARSAFWPFAVFSPEWQAMTWAVEHHREVRFIDLPAAVVLGSRAAEADEPATLLDPEPDPGLGLEEPDEEDGGSSQPDDERLRDDPIAVLARAAGYDDPERWWDDAVESGRDGDDPFDAITEAMGLLRREAPPVRSAAYQRDEARREAHMRLQLRAGLRDHDRVAVVCGAWHAPVLVGRLPAVSADQALLRKLPRTKVQTTWVPWTHSRLSYTSGYGAGIESPGWYEHLFTATDATVERWFTRVAGVLRAHDRPVSSAHAIEATRLADTLAVMRARPMPGLAEVQEAALAVMCDGSELALASVTKDLVVGERLGEVPDDVPLVPLDADLRRTARSVRLTIAAEPKLYTLDLRKAVDRGKSQLLRRMGVLGVRWGEPTEVSGTGTFKEAWTVAWDPQFAVAIVLAAQWGTTVESAATARLLDSIGSLADVTSRVEQALLADLADALPALLAALDERAAHEADVVHLLQALPALARAQRYGTVRGTDTAALAEVARAMLTRACAGLGVAVSGLSPEAAVAVRDHVDAVTGAVPLLGDEARTEWLAALAAAAKRADLPGLLAGRIARVLLDAGMTTAEAAAASLSQALSYGTTVAQRASYAEGFLAGGALLLIHDPRILAVVDDWVRGLGPDEFTDVLPVMRRAFGSYNAPERRAIAERAAARRQGPVERAVTTDDELDLTGMQDVLATVRMLLGRAS